MREEIIEHFKQNDPVLHSWINRVGEIKDLEMENPEEYFRHLMREIIYQQLSGKAGDAIYSRFTELFFNEIPLPETVLDLKHEEIRATGVSNAKVSYIKNIAEAVVNKKLHLYRFPKMSDQEVINELTKIKGIGQWTAEMFLMFALGRENVFSFGDLGLKNGIKNVYGYKKYPAKKTIARLSKKWSPYKTYASLLLWASLD